MDRLTDIADVASPDKDKSGKREPDRDDIVMRAMTHFWREGFYACSTADIAARLGFDKNRLYTDFGGGQGLFVAALERYVDEIIMHGFAEVEAETANAGEIAAYFAAQTEKAIDIGLPGLGCFLQNTRSETTTGNRAVRDVTIRCITRLLHGFQNALAREAEAHKLDDAPIGQLAGFLATTSLGLWIYAGDARDPAELWKYRRLVLEVMEEKLLLTKEEAARSTGLDLLPLKRLHPSP